MQLLLISVLDLCCVVFLSIVLSDTSPGPPPSLPPSGHPSPLASGPCPPSSEEAQEFSSAFLLAAGGHHLHERGGHESRLW